MTRIFAFPLLFSATFVVAMAAASAAPITVPTGLNIGDQYRLAFVTSTRRDATSSNIADYNNFVAAVAAGRPELSALGTTWAAIGSTASIDARDNTATNPSSLGVPIYGLDDIRIAHDNPDLWDSNLLAPLNTDQNGSPVAGLVWTGTTISGTSHPGGYLGADYPLLGLSYASDTRWTSWGQDNALLDRPIYAISGVLTVVPEPSSWALAGLGLVFMLLVAWRKSRAAVRLAPIMVLALCVTGICPAEAVTIPTVLVGNAGNASDPLTGNLYGGVSYDYRIGATEVTNAQYAEFLNYKAAADPLGLYNTSMGSDPRGGVTRSGVSGSFTYTTKSNMGNKPVNYVSWYDSIRFANWLNNGQGLGDTENGAYTLLGGTPTPSNGLSVTRNSGATWFLTSEDEWYKSAYHQPAGQGGDSDGYWLYPTASNTAPTLATANSVGDISNPGANVANYNFAADWNSLNGNVTTVGSAGPLSASYYGTSDQGGNLWEWNEALISGSFRGLRGGSFDSFFANALRSSDGYNNFPTLEVNVYGFRVATVPEPSSLMLAGFAGLGLLFLTRRRRVQRHSTSRARGTLVNARKFFFAAVFVAALAISSTSAYAVPLTFSTYGGLPGAGTINNSATAISADGTKFVGSSDSFSGTQAFRRTVGGGMAGLGDLPGGPTYSEATGVSADGSWVVGISESGLGPEGFRWSSGSGMLGLGDLPGGFFSSSAHGVSANGSVIVGESRSASGYEAYRWTSGGGMVPLGDLAGGSFASYAYDVSADGSVVVGLSTSAAGDEAFRWTSGGGMVGLGDLPGGAFSSSGQAISGDGLVIVGQGKSASGTEAFRWTSGGGMVGLGDLVGGSFSSTALATSVDGSVIVGQSTTALGAEAFLWTPSDGMVNLREYLIGHGYTGVSLTNWKLTTATGISADGHTIVGYGTDPNGYSEAWMATVPEPSSLVLGGLAGLGLLVVARRCRFQSQLIKNRKPTKDPTATYRRRDAGLEARPREAPRRALRADRAQSAQGREVEHAVLRHRGPGLVPGVPLLHALRAGGLLPRHVAVTGPARRQQDRGHPLLQHPRGPARRVADGDVGEASSRAARLGSLADCRIIRMQMAGDGCRQPSSRFTPQRN